MSKIEGPDQLTPGQATKQSLRRAVVWGSGAVIACLLLLIIAVVADYWYPESSFTEVAAMALVAVCALAIVWYLLERLRTHFRQLERFRRGLLALGSDPHAGLPQIGDEDDVGAELRQLHQALQDLNDRWAGHEALPDRRLEAVLASLSDAIVVISANGQVSLVNHAAKALLGAERVAVGSSVYAALSRATVLEALGRAREVEMPVDAMIGTLEQHQLAAKVSSLGALHGGVLIFPAAEVAFRAEIDSDLSLLDLPPPAPPISDDLPLRELPILALDTETTGLDVAEDRVISIGGVRMVGEQIYRGVSLDDLINPGRAIPGRSTAIHGITDAMVAEAGDFAEAFQTLRPHLQETVIVGHQIAFDLAMLVRECELADLTWPTPPQLDTMLLVAVLEPDVPAYSLDAVAEWLGVSVHGRHTALGDALVTAEVFARMVPRLAEQGIVTFGQAKAYAARAKDLVKAQKKAGW